MATDSSPMVFLFFGLCCFGTLALAFIGGGGFALYRSRQAQASGGGSNTLLIVGVVALLLGACFACGGAGSVLSFLFSVMPMQ